MTKPALSIIIPTLNEEKYIGKLLTSLSDQTFKNFEVILVDSESEDKTVSIAKSYKLSLTVVTEKRKGVGLARNTGAKHAKSNTLLFLDADIILPRYFLKDCLNEFEQRFLEVATATSIPISRELRIHLYFYIQNWTIIAGQYFSPLALGYCIFCTKRIHERINGFDENVILGEDTDYAERAGRWGKFRILRSGKVRVSTRRFDKEGWYKVGLKYFGAGAYRIFKGNVESDTFKYHFGKYDKDG